MLESLSAMVDDEACELELRRVLKSLDDDEATLDYWHRYQLAGAAMRKESHIDCSVNLLGAINAELDGESSLASGEGTQAGMSYTTNEKAGSVAVFAQQKWKALAGQAMIAASIAAVFVVSFNYVGPNSSESAGSPQLATIAPVEVNTHVVADSVPIGFNLPLPEARVVGGGNSTAVKPSRATTGRYTPVSRYNDDLSDPATQQVLDQLLIEHASRSSMNGSLGFMPFARVSKMDAVQQ